MNHGLMKSQTLFYAKRGGVQPIDANNFAREIDSIQTGSGNVATGTFVTSSERHGITHINVGFEPDLVFVAFSISTKDGIDTVSYWYRDLSYGNSSAIWCVTPAEGVAYLVQLGRTGGETGIQQINSDGFSFIVNGWNTLGRTCRYVCVKL